LGLAKKPSAAVPSQARQRGRRLVLDFISAEIPELDRIEFHANSSPKFEYRQRSGEDKTRSFKAAKVSKALSIFFLDYLCAGLHIPSRRYLLEGGDGTLAAALGNGMANLNGSWGSLFVEFLPTGKKANRVSAIFGGKNWDGKSAKHRLIFVKPDYLPADCIEIIWDGQRLTRPEEIQKLTGQFRKAWELPPPSQPDLPIGEGSEGKPEPGNKPEKADEVLLPNFKLPKLATEVFGNEPPPPAAKKSSKAPESAPKVDAVIQEAAIEFKSIPKPEDIAPPKPPPARIDPRLFEIQNPDRLEWNDSDGLINFGDDDSEADIWRIRDASEGVLIFGAVGSGKTSGSGSAVATAFLQAGYGGLILTAKPDEADRWLRLCERTGRAADCVHVTPGSGHCLNVLEYESQRPGDRLTVTDDLIALLRCIIAVMSRSKRGNVDNVFGPIRPMTCCGTCSTFICSPVNRSRLTALSILSISPPRNPAVHGKESNSLRI